MRHIHADNIIIAANDTSIEWQRMLYANWANIGKSGSFTFYPDSQYRQKPAPHPHQAMIDQAAADPSIKWQFFNSLGEVWIATTPTWIRTMQYRQEPAAPVMVDLWQWAFRYCQNGPIFNSPYVATLEEVSEILTCYSIICRIEGSKISVEVSQ
jgi:hypothetical protein